MTLHKSTSDQKVPWSSTEFMCSFQEITACSFGVMISFLKLLAFWLQVEVTLFLFWIFLFWCIWSLKYTVEEFFIKGWSLFINCFVNNFVTVNYLCLIQIPWCKIQFWCMCTELRMTYVCMFVCMFVSVCVRVWSGFKKFVYVCL